MEIISKRIALITLTAGLFIIWLLSLFFIDSFITNLVLIFGLILSIAFLYRPKWGIFLILFLRPSIDKFSDQITVSLGNNLNFNAAAIFGIVVVLLLIIFLIKNIGELKWLPVKKTWLLFITIALLSIIFSLDKIASIYGIIKIISIFLIFSSAYVLVKKEKDPKSILLAIIFSSIIPFLSAIYQLLTGSGVAGSEGVESRLFGTFSHPNPFASFVLISVSVLLFLILKERDFGKKWLFSSWLALGFIILEQTYARGAWLAFLIFLFIITIKKSPKVLVVLFVAFVVLFSLSTSIQNRIQDVYNPPADSSVRWRFEQWDRVYKSFVKKPLTGYGIGTETIVHENEYGPNAGNQYTHNDFLRIALETGIFGCIIYSALLFLALAKLIQAYRQEKNPWRKHFGLFVLALYVGLLSYSLTNNNLNETVTQWLMWGVIGTAFALFELSREEEPSLKTE